MYLIKPCQVTKKLKIWYIRGDKVSLNYKINVLTETLQM